jgi:hypothetical protein
MNISHFKELKQRLLARDTDNNSSVEIEIEYNDNDIASIIIENLEPLQCKIRPLIEYKFTSALADDIFYVQIAESINESLVLLIIDESMASGRYFLMGIQENKNHMSEFITNSISNWTKFENMYWPDEKEITFLEPDLVTFDMLHSTGAIKTHGRS